MSFADSLKNFWDWLRSDQILSGAAGTLISAGVIWVLSLMWAKVNSTPLKLFWFRRKMRLEVNRLEISSAVLLTVVIVLVQSQFVAAFLVALLLTYVGFRIEWMSEPTTEDPKIVVHSATYEWSLPLNYGLKQLDVSRKVRELVTRGTRKFVVSPACFGLPDPAPNIPKVLKIHYSIDGKEYDQNIADGLLMVFK